MPVAQPDRASDYESEGREFESLRARQSSARRLYLVEGGLYFLDGYKELSAPPKSFHPPVWCPSTNLEGAAGRLFEENL
ncbi:protein of unknown function [Kyrpidia spormannii]|uniref:Uncharacterized protein n=1 Tax=Kyrpidia spormannii TaxID=2055160 RepID=A0ACA8Z9H9_9BACL|nr:protein of unknown function [Kyrpidia spormannii]